MWYVLYTNIHVSAYAYVSKQKLVFFVFFLNKTLLISKHVNVFVYTANFPPGCSVLFDKNENLHLLSSLNQHVNSSYRIGLTTFLNISDLIDIWG